MIARRESCLMEPELNVLKEVKMEEIFRKKIREAKCLEGSIRKIT